MKQTPWVVTVLSSVRTFLSSARPLPLPSLSLVPLLVALPVLITLLGMPACGGGGNAPSVVPSPSPVAGASPSPTPQATPTPGPSPSPEPSPTPEPQPNPTPHPTPQAPPPDMIITIVGDNGGMSYSPSSASARVGQTVIWRNADSTTHTATANNGAFNTGFIPPGGQSSLLMSSAGNFNYHCSVHPSMVASLSVSP